MELLGSLQTHFQLLVSEFSTQSAVSFAEFFEQCKEFLHLLVEQHELYDALISHSLQLDEENQQLKVNDLLVSILIS
jgi:hypothetical protein